LKKYSFKRYLVDGDFSKKNPEERFRNIQYLKALIVQKNDPWGKWFNWEKGERCICELEPVQWRYQ